MMARDRALAAAIGACSLALLAPLAWPLFTGRVFVYNDLSSFHLPMRYLYQQALRAGDSLLWTPAIFSGLYLHGEGQIGLFHPLHLLLYGALPLQAAFDLELIANYVAAFAGMYWLLRRLGFARDPSLFGAMLFAFSGFGLLHHHHLNLVAIVAHLPWLLAATDVMVVDHRPRVRAAAFAGVAAILASELLLGFPQGVWWNGIALVAFAASRLTEIGSWRPILPCAAALGVGLLLGGIQLLPSADTAVHSLRATVSRDFALSYSLHPLNLVQFIAPYALAGGAYGPLDYPWFHEFGIYSGAVLPVALAWVWARRAALAPDRRRLVGGATAFAVLLLLLALGRHGGIDVLLTYLPVLGSLRAPVRYIVLVQFALAILAAVAIEDLLAIRDGSVSPPGTVRAVWIPALLGSATFLFNLHVLPDRAARFAPAAHAAPGLLIVLTVTVLFVAAAGRARWAPIAIAVITAIDLGAWGVAFVYREPARKIGSLTQAIELPGTTIAEAYAAAPEDGPYRSDLLVLRGYRLTSGYVGLYPATRHPIDSPIARRLSGTRWVFSQDGVRMPYDDGVARARLLDDQLRPADGRVEVVTDRPGYIVARVSAPARLRLALTERFSDGWRATADGVPLAMTRIDGDFLGCLVKPGVHRIELRFMPRSFVWGAGVTAVGAALLALGVAIIVRRPATGAGESSNL